MTIETLQLTVSGLTATALFGIVAVGWKIARHLARMEFQLELVWGDYVRRVYAEPPTSKPTIR